MGDMGAMKEAPNEQALEFETSTLASLHTIEDEGQSEQIATFVPWTSLFLAGGGPGIEVGRVPNPRAQEP